MDDFGVPLFYETPVYMVQRSNPPPPPAMVMGHA